MIALDRSRSCPGLRSFAPTHPAFLPHAPVRVVSLRDGLSGKVTEVFRRGDTRLIGDEDNPFQPADEIRPPKNDFVKVHLKVVGGISKQKPDHEKGDQSEYENDTQDDRPKRSIAQVLS